MIKINHKETLVYCDEPQLFTGNNGDDLYLCLLIDNYFCPLNVHQMHTGRYLCIPTSEQEINNFCAGKLDLRNIFQHAKNYFLSGDELELEPYLDKVHSEWLPLVGFKMNKVVSDDLL